MSREQDALLTETIARHFPGARIVANDIDLGFAGLHITCSVDSLQEIGPYTAASLFFSLRSADLGSDPVFASVSGYAESSQAAIVAGGCNWASAFGPVLRAGLGGEEQPEVDCLEVMLDGQGYRLFIDGLDRAMLYNDNGASTIETRVAAARARFGASPWLAPQILARGSLPILASDRPTVLSVFASDRADQRLVEVKINGRDWPVTIFADVPPEPAGAATLLRELAVLVPARERPWVTRPSLLRTLEGLAAQKADRRTVAWPGWRSHGGVWEEPASKVDLERIEDGVGPLPADYRAFLGSVAVAGAGPGYGLLPPTGVDQQRLAFGTFDWTDEGEPTGRPAGSLALAHAGCGILWLLILRGPSRGEVWVDARSSDGHVRRVAPTFDSWYRRWLDAAVRDGNPWSQWNSLCCATPGVLSQMLLGIQKEGLDPDAAVAELPNRLGPGAIKIMSGGSDYFAAQERLDPCQPCVALAARLGIGGEVFAPTSLASMTTDNSGAPSLEPPSGFLARLSRRFRGRLH